MNKKNILLITSEFPPQPGGIGNHAFNLANHLQKNHFSVTVITDNRSPNGQEEQLFDSSNSFTTKRIKVTKPRDIMYFKRILAAFSEIKRSYIIIASGKFPLWITALFSFFYKRKYIAVLHGTEVNFSSVLKRETTNFSLKRFTTIIAVSNFTKSLVSHLSLKNIRVIPNGISLSVPRNSPEKQLLKGKPVLITVGNVTNRKGQLNVIKALPDLLKDFPEIHYHCVGLPTEKETFLKEATRLGVEKHITFHGRVSEAKLREFLQESDIFVMLSNTTNTGDVEGFGIAILEANYFGKPAIGSLGCGIEDAIDDGKTGFLIDKNNSEAFLNAINTILKEYPVFSKNAKQWATHHNWDRIILKYLDVINP